MSIPHFFKFFCFTFLLAVGAKAVFAESGRLSFGSQSYDFGKVHQGEPVTFDFPFKNVGAEEVIVEGVFAACGCITVNKLVGQIFYPGDSGFLKVEFDSQRFEGKIRKKIVLATNSKGITSHTLTLSGLVESTINIVPPVLAFEKIIRNSEKSLTAKINVKNGFDLQDIKLKYDQNKLKVLLSKNSKNENEIQVSIVDSSQIGILKESVTVMTNHPKQKEVKLLVRAEIINSIVSSKKYIEFGALNEEGQSHQTIVLTGIENISEIEPKSELYINGLKISEGSHLIDINPISDNQSGRQEVKVSLNRTPSGGQKFKGPLTGFLNFKSKVKNEELKIPVYGYFF